MANATASDVTITDLKINGGTASAEVLEAITSSTLTQTITGASTLALGLFDPTRSLLRSTLCMDRSTLILDDLTFELAAVSKSGDILTLTFEDYAIASLRRHEKTEKAAAGTTSRVAFCRRVISKYEPWIVVDGPDSGPTILEEIAIGKYTTAATSASSDPLSGLDTGKGNLSADQIATYASQAGFHGENLQIAVAVALAESSGSPTAKNGQYIGLWQVGTSHGYTVAHLEDPQNNADAAFKLYTDTLGETLGGWLQWQTYTGPTRDGFNSRYKQFMKEAGIAANSVDPKGLTTDPLDTSASTSTTSGQRETLWVGVTRIMTEIGWRVFGRRGHIVIAPDSWLLRQPGVTLNEDSDGVDSIDFDVDRGKKVSTATITCRADRWTVKPGEPVTYTDMGPCDGSMLVSQISRSLTSTSATVTTAKKQKQLAEPSSVSDSGTNLPVTSALPRGFRASSPDVQKMVDFAIAQVRKPYVMGGNGPNSWDCSGLVVGATTAGGHRIGARVAEAQYELCVAKGLNISVVSAMKVCGALLFAPGSDPSPTGFGIGHVAISLGNGQCVAAASTRQGVIRYETSASEWTYAGLPPHFQFSKG